MQLERLTACMLQAVEKKIKRRFSDHHPDALSRFLQKCFFFTAQSFASDESVRVPSESAINSVVVGLVLEG